MKFGIPIGNFGTLGKYGDAGDVVAVAERAELLGYDSVWVHDHIFMPALIESRYPYNESGVAGFAYHQDIYDPIAMMAAVAVRTSRVQIGTSVLIVPYRDPLVQAQMIATLDQLSGGRVLLGIGVGWMEEEFEALGIGEQFPVRGRVTDEWIGIARELWTSEGPASYEGRYRSFRDMGGIAKCAQQPHVPIWVGGKGPIASRRVARYGNGYSRSRRRRRRWRRRSRWSGKNARRRGAISARSRSRCSGRWCCWTGIRSRCVASPPWPAAAATRSSRCWGDMQMRAWSTR